MYVASTQAPQEEEGVQALRGDPGQQHQDPASLVVLGEDYKNLFLLLTGAAPGMWRPLM